MLRAGYAGLGLAFAAMAATLAVPSLILGGLALAFAGGVLLAFAEDDMPKWAGIILIVYFLLSALAFVATTSVTINQGGERYFFAPPNMFGDVIYWIGLVSPIMLAAATIAAVWEREPAPRYLLAGALAGMLLFAILTVVLTPGGEGVTDAARASESQGDMLQTLFALSAGVGAVGALWAASRPDSY